MTRIERELFTVTYGLETCRIDTGIHRKHHQAPPIKIHHPVEHLTIMPQHAEKSKLWHKASTYRSHPLAGIGGGGGGGGGGAGVTTGSGGGGATTSSQHPQPMTNSMAGKRRTLNKPLRDFILPPFLG